MLFRKTKELQSLVNASRKALANAEDQIEDLLHLRLQEQHNNEIILKENAKLKARIVDLENNVEFLYNNLSAKNKALIEGNKKRNKKRELVGIGTHD